MTDTHATAQVDLTNCDREPIHIPGRIQPHGLLLALAEPDLHILQISTNTQPLIGQAPEALLGQPLDTLLAEEHINYLRTTLALEDLEQNPLYVWTTHLHGSEQLFDGLIHRHNGVLLLELEPAHPRTWPGPDVYRTVKSVISKLQRAPTFATFCDAIAREVRALTRFDRVMIYQFDQDGHGSVIAEAAADDVTPYLGLHYPASDIPKQARALYLRNWLRLIPDVRYTPADVVPTLTPRTDAPLDLSYSILRSVSPIHIEYLINMGVGASMSISLVKNGELWGLIACHHREARYLPYEIRSACEYLGQAVSLQLEAKENAEDFQYHVRLKEMAVQLVQRGGQAASWDGALFSGSPTLQDLVTSSGAALCVGGRVTTLGTTPAEADIRMLVAWLQEQPEVDVYATNKLALEYPPLAHCKDTASGVLAAPLARELGDYLLWFRPEVIQTVNWSGEPTKAVTVSDDGVRISPRTSFDLWQQTVALHSLPWKAVEIGAAMELRNGLRGVVMRHAAELAQLNAKLERSNIELDEFALIASHDLKEPLRGLHNYAHFLIDDYLDRLDADGRSKLETITRLTQRMDTLIDSLLHYSRIGRVELAIQETDLNILLEELLETLSVSREAQQTEIRIPRPLPTIRCDRVRIGEVFYNLISNAIKYNTKADTWVEIGYRAPEEEHPASERRNMYTFYVRDNGVGIPAKHFETIFQIFKRLHARDQFGGGTGAGLTIAKKIIERHNGTIWVESTPGVGTTFFFTVQG